MKNLALQTRLISVESKEEKKYLRPKKATTRNTCNFRKKKKENIESTVPIFCLLRIEQLSFLRVHPSRLIKSLENFR